MIRFNIEGFDEIVDAMEKKIATVETETKTAVLQAGFKTERDMKSLAPVDTGTLRRSIHTKMLDEFTAEVGTNIEYATFVEFGTLKMAAQPFVTPAKLKNEKDFIQKMKDIAGGGF